MVSGKGVESNWQVRKRGKLAFLGCELRTDTLSNEPSSNQTREGTVNQAMGHWQGALGYSGVLGKQPVNAFCKFL